MPRVVVLGGGIVGLSTGMLLAERGCEVTVVERDPARVPESPDGAWQDWDRPGVGRRSPLPGWLTAIGAREPARNAEDSGFIYYTRNFRPKDGTEPPPFLTGLLIPFECFSLLTLPGDADPWSVTVYVSTHDPALKEIRHPENWQAVVAVCPLHAHLLDGVPITDVVAMGGVLDRYRRYVIDGSPVTTGVLSVGDAIACTNPSLGRGMTLGMMHAAGTVDVVFEHLGDPLALALAHDEMTQARIAPWYQNTIALDRARLAQLDAAAGRPVTPPAAGPGARVMRDLTVAMLHDADLFRAFIEIIAMYVLPQEVLARTGLADRIGAVAAEREEFVMPGPTRADVLATLS